ncbi:MAG: hypothetical protein WC748_06195 [Legionellales bacterium]|jgi:Tfp pilus assembly protein PilX
MPRGNILMTVLIILTLLSITTLYAARESLWAAKTSHTEKDNLQLDMRVAEVLLKVEQLINGLPLEIIPNSIENCLSSCIVVAYEGNFFLEQDLQALPAAYVLSMSGMQVWVVLEYLQPDYFRSSFLIVSENKQVYKRMQANWKRTTLRSILQSLR